MNLRLGLFLAAAGLALGGAAAAQTSSLYQQGGQGPAPLLPQASWIRTPPPPLREIRVHDLVSIRVQEGAEMLAEGQVERRKNASFNAVLLDWLTLNGLTSATPNGQADGDPRIRGQLDQLYRAETGLETRESLTFNIAAEVADVRSNGTLVLEAHRQIRNNNEVWEYSLTGVCRKEDIGPGNLVLSKDIADLRIQKRELGHVADGYRRGWFTKLYDLFNPF